jgi:hypothetical protein
VILHRFAIVRTDVSEELSASIITMTTIDELRATFAIIFLCISSQPASVSSYGYVPTSPILVTLVMEALSSFETSALTRATRRNIPEDDILHTLPQF